jgi:hypothetical protein
VWPLLVVVLAPALGDDLCLLQAVEDLAVEKLVSQLAIEALAVAVLPGAAWLNEQGLRADLGKPVSNDLRSHLRAIV